MGLSIKLPTRRSAFDTSSYIIMLKHPLLGGMPIKFIGKGAFTNYVYKRRGVGGQKNRLFVNIYTIENVKKSQTL